MKIQSLTLFLFFILFPLDVFCENFVVVIDAGHGGKDPGSIGRKGYEKNINLQVAMQVGVLISQNFNDVTVKYTRTTDIFVPLDRRAEIANNVHADLFISIHTNALSRKRSSYHGTETYTLGLARTPDNLEVAKKENSVILIEDDYQKRYAGFNPHSSESYIIFEYIQDNNMKESIELAKLIQYQFRSHAKRVDHGVKQAGFLVLRQTSMASVLVELGYISNPKEEIYMLSKAGQTALAQSIYQAFAIYKSNSGRDKATESILATKESRKKTIPAENDDTDNAIHVKNEHQVNQQEDDNSSPNGIVFKIQIMATPTRLKSNNKCFKGLKPIDFYKEGKLYKYTTGNSCSHSEIQKQLKEVSRKFKDAFIVAFKDNKKIDYKKAIQTNNRKRKNDYPHKTE